MDSIEGLDVASVLGECAGISEFLSRFVVEDGDDAIVEGLQMSLQDVDDPNRLIHFVRFRCRAPEELAFHLERHKKKLMLYRECPQELRLGNPYRRRLVRDEMMVQETYDFFVLLRQMSFEMPSFIRLSPGLQRAIQYAIGGIGDEEARPRADDEDDEQDAVETDSGSEDMEPGSDESEDEARQVARYVPPSTRRNRRDACRPPAKRSRVRRASGSDSDSDSDD